MRFKSFLKKYKFGIIWETIWVLLFVADKIWLKTENLSACSMVFFVMPWVNTLSRVLDEKTKANERASQAEIAAEGSDVDRLAQEEAESVLNIGETYALKYIKRRIVLLSFLILLATALAIYFLLFSPAFWNPVKHMLSFLFGSFGGIFLCGLIVEIFRLKDNQDKKDK